MPAAPTSEVLRTEVRDRVGVVTLNRPEARNALNTELLRAIRRALPDLDADDAVDVVVVTGADPAFCAGLDLKELGSTGANLGSATGKSDRRERPWAFWDPVGKPVIAAVNGAAVTGGFELALQCDFIVASERARFGDSHARVGVLPAGGLSVLLPQAVGVRRAKELSLTGNFLTADDAYRMGLVNHVVAHDQLLPTALRLAADIVSNDQAAVRALLDEYRRTTETTAAEGLRIEAELARNWQGRTFDPAEVERRRRAVTERGRTQA